MRLRTSIASKLAFAIIFGVLGLTFTIAAIVMTINDNAKKEAWDKIEATMIVVDHHLEKVELNYVYKENIYFANSSVYSSFDEVGDRVFIYVNPNNPNEIYEEGLSTVFIVFYCVGLPFLLIGICSLILDIKFRKNKKICMESGFKKVVDVIEVVKTNYYVNNEACYIIKVKSNGIEYKSQRFLLPVAFNPNIKTVVDMYILDEKKYFIDLTSIREKREDDF